MSHIFGQLCRPSAGPRQSMLWTTCIPVHKSHGGVRGVRTLLPVENGSQGWEVADSTASKVEARVLCAPGEAETSSSADSRSMAYDRCACSSGHSLMLPPL